MIQQILLYAVAALVMYSVVKDGILSGNAKKSFAIIKTIRPVMFVQNFIVQVVVAILAMLLNTVPVINWGWWQLLDSDSSAGGANAYIAISSLPVIGIIFMAILFLALPRLAEMEEELFRDGTRNWNSAVKRSVVFGLVHCLVGVSIGVGLALSIAGLWYSYQYFKGGVVRSTAYHASWNMAIVSLVVVSLFIS